MKTILVLLGSVSVCVATSPFFFGPCNNELLSTKTGIKIKNKDWEGDFFINIETAQPGKMRCVTSKKVLELDSSQYAVFRENIHYRDKTGKGHVQFTEMYQVAPDHYVFKYSFGKGQSARVHFKWLKFIPGVLDMHYACTNDDKFSHNTKDFIFIKTSSPEPSQTVSLQIREVLDENKFDLEELRMVPNCHCFEDQSDCKDLKLYQYLEYRLP